MRLDAVIKLPEGVSDSAVQMGTDDGDGYVDACVRSRRTASCAVLAHCNRTSFSLLSKYPQSLNHPILFLHYILTVVHILEVPTTPGRGINIWRGPLDMGVRLPGYIQQATG